MEEQPWMHHVTHRCCHAIFHITSVHPFLKIKEIVETLSQDYIDWLVWKTGHSMAPESCHETTLSWVQNAYLCPYFPLDSSGQQRGSRGDVRCNQSTEDNHAGAEESLLSSRQCWVCSLRLHYGVCYNPWPPVAPGFFRSARKQGHRWPEGSNN